MLKKILGQAPFDVELSGRITITPGKKSLVTLLFSNVSEYDLPLSCSLNFSTSVEADKTKFDITLPADGKTQCDLTFSKDTDSRMFCGCGIAELEILDRIFDSRTLYEFDIFCEAAYKCAENKDDFSPSDEALFTRNGRFFANKGETVFMEIPLARDEEYKLSIPSGKIKNKNDGDILKLTSGLNKLSFEILEDGSFDLKNPVSDEKVYIDTINTKYFM